MFVDHEWNPNEFFYCNKCSHPKRAHRCPKDAPWPAGRCRRPLGHSGYCNDQEGLMRISEDGLKLVSTSTLAIIQGDLSSGDPAFLDVRGLYTVEAAAMVNAELESRS